MPMTQGVPQKVAEACHILNAYGQEHFYLGHVSARDGEGSDRFWVKPSGIGLGEVTAADLALVDLDGHQLRGDRPVHHEMPIHAEIYRARPDVSCVVHTHPFYAAAFAAAVGDFRMVSQDSVLFANGFGWYASPRLVVTPEQGRELADALGTYQLAVLANHGIVAADETVEGATFLAVSFDRSLRLQATAAAFGPIREIPPDDVAGMNDYFSTSYRGRVETTFDYLLRQAAPERGEASSDGQEPSDE